MVSHIHLFRSPSRHAICRVSVFNQLVCTDVYSQVLRQQCGPSISGSPPTAMHRLCVHVYVARVLHPHECMHRMRLLYPDRICVEARPEQPPRRVLLLHHVPAHSNVSHLHLVRPLSRSAISSFVRSRRLSTLRCLPFPYISLALPLCNLACAHSVSFILSLCTGPRPSQPWCDALHICILPCLPSPSLSFPLSTCSISRLISLSFISAYPVSRVSHLRLFRSSSLIYKHRCVCIYPSGIATAG